MTDDNKKAKMLEKVRALLAKADSTPFEGEADVFRAKADELMTAYAIEAWMVDQAQAGVNARQMPVRRDFDFGWYTGEFRRDLWSMFLDLGWHCRVEIVNRRANFTTKTIPVIGLSSDIDYLDMLFTSLLVQLSRKIDPKPSHDLSYMENLVMLKETGFNWDQIAERMINAGLDETDTQQPFEKRRNKMTRDYRAWCKKTGHQQSYHDWQSYRRNFAAGFSERIGARLSEMRRGSERAYDANHEAGSAALAIRDIRDLIEDVLYAEFPDLKPHDPGCQCPTCTAKRKPVRYRRDTRKTDWAARSAGEKAGAEAKIEASSPASGRVGGRREELER